MLIGDSRTKETKGKKSWRKIKPKRVIKVPFASNNLPMANATLPNLQKQEYQALVSAVNVANESNQNLEKSQKE